MTATLIFLRLQYSTSHIPLYSNDVLHLCDRQSALSIKFIEKLLGLLHFWVKHLEKLNSAGNKMLEQKRKRI